MAQADKSLNCRMYENEYPEKDDLVVVQVKSIAEMGAYCSLLEYNNIEGMILMSELSRRRIRSVKRLIRVGRQEIVAVLRVAPEKGYIDLSKKRVSPEEVAKVEERWNKSKAVHSIMRHVSKKTKYGVEELYKMFGWPMAKHFGHAYDGFKFAMENREEFLKEFHIAEDIQELLFRGIENRLKPQVRTIRAYIEVTCFSQEGILAIRKALKKGLEHSSEEHPVAIKLVKPPLYDVSLSCLDTQAGMKQLVLVLGTVAEAIVELGGKYALKSEPSIVDTSEKI
jgi:translation initiation factor 2 subunit 1